MKNFTLEFLQTELIRIAEWIQFSDKKTAFLAVYYSAIFGFLFSQKKSISQHLIIYQNQQLLLYLYIFILLGILVSFLFGVFFLFKSIFPRLKNPLTDKSMFYFGNVANMKYTDYLEEIKKLTNDEAKKQIIKQIYINSTIANQKITDVQKTTKILGVLIFFTIILL